MQRGRILSGAATSGTRPLTIPLLLETVRRDPGMTAVYYANRYFGKGRQMEVMRALWGELKLHGQVTIDRIDGPEEPPRWYPVFSMPRRIHKIRLHRAEEEDLSVLHQGVVGDREINLQANEVNREAYESMTSTTENNIISLVQAIPGRDIQFYIGELPVAMQSYAPIAFRRLREAELITREQTPQGTFVWK